ncbi:MAG: S-layer protein [Paucimonas sp.]|nr:S-layer protein [Paucimonas sp.]
MNTNIAARKLGASLSMLLLAACGGGVDHDMDGSKPQRLLGLSEHAVVRAAPAATAADYETVVQQLYLGYFGRPADPMGLQNFTAALFESGAPTTAAGLLETYQMNAVVRGLVDAFSSSPESKSLYSGADNFTFINEVFHNVLGRDVQLAGLTFWSNALSDGRLTRSNAALAIMVGALSNNTEQGLVDALVISKKVSVAAGFTASVDTANDIANYRGESIAGTARTMMRSVNIQTDVESFRPTIDSLMSDQCASVGLQQCI